MNKLINTTIFTNEISLKNNLLTGTQYNYTPQYERRIGTTNDGKYFTELSLSIKNTDEHPFPVDIYVKMTAIFTLAELPQNDIERFLKFNGVQILLPYLRTAVTSITASATMVPIVLPIMDVTQMFPNDMEDVLNDDNTKNN